jgi:hypothetical protein
VWSREADAQNDVDPATSVHQTTSLFIVECLWRSPTLAEGRRLSRLNNDAWTCMLACPVLHACVQREAHKSMCSASVKQACPKGIYLTPTPRDPHVWQGALFVRKGRVAVTIAWMTS